MSQRNEPWISDDEKRQIAAAMREQAAALDSGERERAKMDADSIPEMLSYEHGWSDKRIARALAALRSSPAPEPRELIEALGKVLEVADAALSRESDREGGLVIDARLYAPRLLWESLTDDDGNQRAAEGQRDERAQALEDAAKIAEQVAEAWEDICASVPDAKASVYGRDAGCARYIAVEIRALASGTTHQEGT